MKPPVVISLGGSVIAPDGIDTAFLRRCAASLKSISRHHRVAVITGGGMLARTYVSAARVAGVRNQVDLHWIGIRSCQLNAELLRAALRQTQPVVLDKARLSRLRYSPIVVAPSKPGTTSDYGAILIAEALGAKRVLNVTNVDGVYTADPRNVRTARYLPELSWRQFQRMFGRTVKPGMHVPFDPLASRRAARSGISVIVLSSNLANLERAAAGRSFRGTIIR